MTEQEQNSQKTVMAFVAGLLVGGLIVWVFSSSPAEESKMLDKNGADVAVTESEDSMSNDSEVELTTSDDTDLVINTNLEMGTGNISIADQEAGEKVALESVTFPSTDGWIGVRDYSDGNMGNILGVARFSQSQNLIPTEVNLLRATEADKSYIAVFFTEDGDMEFNLATDVQVSSGSTVFTAK